MIHRRKPPSRRARRWAWVGRRWPKLSPTSSLFEEDLLDHHGRVRGDGYRTRHRFTATDMSGGSGLPAPPTGIRAGQACLHPRPGSSNHSLLLFARKCPPNPAVTRRSRPPSRTSPLRCRDGVRSGDDGSGQLHAGSFRRRARGNGGDAADSASDAETAVSTSYQCIVGQRCPINLQSRP